MSQPEATALTNVPTQLGDFEGTWRVTRQIADARGADGTFTGQAVFRPSATGLLYSETGQLTLGNAQFTAERTYLWSSPSHGQIAVQFADQRPFHHFALEAHPTALHDCPPDTYQVGYDFTLWPKWTSTWHVTGPRKDYVMTSSYTRAR